MRKLLASGFSFQVWPYVTLHEAIKSIQPFQLSTTAKIVSPGDLLIKNEQVVVLYDARVLSKREKELC